MCGVAQLAFADCALAGPSRSRNGHKGHTQHIVSFIYILGDTWLQDTVHGLVGSKNFQSLRTELMLLKALTIKESVGRSH